jgi:hypothetical protein
MSETGKTRTYKVNLHHVGGFVRTSKVEAANRSAAEKMVRDQYPAKAIRKIVVL